MSVNLEHTVDILSLKRDAAEIHRASFMFKILFCKI